MATLTPSPPPDASATRRGLVSLLAQSFAGVKTFLAGVVAAGVNPPVTNSSTLGTSLLRWAAVHTHAVTFADGSVQTTKGETASLASAGTGHSLVDDGTGPVLAIKSIREGPGISVFDDGAALQISATLTAKPVVGDGSNIVVTEGPTEIEVGLAADIGVNNVTTGNVNALSGVSWLSIGQNLTTGRVRLGATDVLTHALGTLVVEGGEIRSGPNDGQQRVLNHGPNTPIELHTGAGFAYAANWSSFTGAFFIIDPATRSVQIHGDFGTPTAATATNTWVSICTLPTEIRPGAAGAQYGVIHTNSNPLMLRVFGAALAIRIGPTSLPSGSSGGLYVGQIRYFLA